jgi:hypothetical protein
MRYSRKLKYSVRSLPLGYFFCLETKEAKIQDGKNLLPAGPTPGPVFRRAFTRVSKTGIKLHLS